MSELRRREFDPPRLLSKVRYEAQARFSELNKMFSRERILSAIERLTNIGPAVVGEILFNETNPYPSLQDRVLQCARDITAKDIAVERKPVEPPGITIRTTRKIGQRQPAKTSSPAYTGTFLRIAKTRLQDKGAKKTKHPQESDYRAAFPLSPRRKKRETKVPPGSKVALEEIKEISREEFMKALSLEDRFILAKIFQAKGLEPFPPFRHGLDLILLKNWSTIRIGALLRQCLSLGILIKTTKHRKIRFQFLPSDLLSPENSGIFADLSDKKNLFLLELFGYHKDQPFVYAPESGSDFEELLNKGYVVKASAPPSENKYAISQEALGKLEKAMLI